MPSFNGIMETLSLDSHKLSAVTRPELVPKITSSCSRNVFAQSIYQIHIPVNSGSPLTIGSTTNHKKQN